MPTLRRCPAKTLKEVLLEDDIVVHCLEPKGGHSYDDLPYADTAGRESGSTPRSFSRRAVCSRVL